MDLQNSIPSLQHLLEKLKDEVICDDREFLRFVQHY